MNFGELKTAILSDSHRPDLSGEVARFVREAEGQIRRELRAFPVTVTLDDTSRVDAGIYNLPTTLLEIRSLHRADQRGDGLENTSLHAIRRMPLSADPLWYAVQGPTVEIRGTPTTGAEFDLVYLGHPAPLVNDSDTNSLLTDHEVLYTQGALFALYRHTQDLELAQAALDTYGDVLQKLNEQFGRKIGGASIAGAYNFSIGGSSY